MHELKKIFFKKKILIYGLSLTGISTFDYLRKTNFVSVYLFLTFSFFFEYVILQHNNQ